MKIKLTIILSLCLLAITTGLKAQTAEETAEWLNAKLPSLVLKDDWAKETSSTTEILKQKTEVMEYKNITSITSSHQEKTDEKLEHTKITFVGKFNETNKIDLVLKPTITDKELTSLIKAFTHIAELNGAKIAKDDLF